MAASAVGAPAAWAGWSSAFELVKPGSLDYLPTQLAFSPGGAAAAAFATDNVDTPGSSQAYLVVRAADGAISPTWPLPATGQVLALAYDRSGIELLIGPTSGGLDCCSSAEAVRFTVGGSLQRPQTLVGGLTGATLARLVVLGDARMLAAIATEQGVWALQSNRAGSFSGKRRLTATSEAPESLSATWLGGENSLVAWTAASGPPGSADPRDIYYAQGSKKDGPQAAHVLLAVAAGHRIDELGVARHGSGATAAWVESWYDAHGYHSQVREADFGSHPTARSLSSANGQASGISFAADAAGAQAVAWETCTGAGTCSVHVATRGAKGQFGFPVALGAIDATQTPSVAVGPGGQVVVGWVRNGNPVAAVGSAGGGRFGPVQVLSPTVYALDLTVAFGPRRDALVVWTQGTLNPSVVATDYHAP